MRQDVFVKGMIPLAIGAILILCGIMTAKSETRSINENAFDDSCTYELVDNHEYVATTYLLHGTYELRYNFTSSEPITQFYVYVLGPDSYELKSVYGPPASYQYQNASLTFEALKSGEYAFVLGGRWMSLQIDLDRQLQSDKSVYPFEIVFYVGLPLFIGGFFACIFGILKKSKPTYWLDRL